MAALAQLTFEPRAAERFSTEVFATVLRSGAFCAKIRIDSLSALGFSTPSATDVAPSEVVGVELPNLARRDARVIHSNSAGAGFMFMSPLTDEELIRVFDRPETIITAPQTSTGDAILSEPDVAPFDNWIRTTLAITLASATWIAIAAVIYAL